ncbi:MAG: hypothetical protein ACRDRJ_23005 [Streptosporangiaceae bacterium]
MSADNDPDVVIVLVPALVIILRHAEDRKGSPLSESEVLAVRDNAPCIAMPRAEAANFIEARGYTDIDPRRCWEDLLQDGAHDSIFSIGVRSPGV